MTELVIINKGSKAPSATSAMKRHQPLPLSLMLVKHQSALFLILPPRLAVARPADPITIRVNDLRIQKGACRWVP
eukprot:scaffold413452_cov14-Prasinocladus_malaysianus.AAC.1